MDYLNGIAKEGVLGALAVASIVLNGVLGKMLLGEKDKRIDDAKKVGTELAAPIAHIKDSLELINEKVKISKENS